MAASESTAPARASVSETSALLAVASSSTAGTSPESASAPAEAAAAETTAAAAATTSEAAALAQPAPHTLSTPSPPPTGRTSKRQSHVVSFDKTLENILKLGKYDLEIQDTELVVTDREKRKKNRRACAPSPNTYRTTIPLYNILWACVSDDLQNVVIDYAEAVSKTRLQPAKLVLSIETGPDRPTAAEANEWADRLRACAYGKAPQQRRAYVLVNPHAGPGGAMKKWENDAKPLLDAARMQLTVVTTKYSGQAVELCTALDIDKYDIVIPCSGDGLPHEVFNGLGKRPDARRALERIAVAHLPCGSGNAMSCNLYGTHRVSLATLAIIKGVVAPLDLVSVTHGEERLLSFLSQAVGIVAEVDLGTEHLRWMGGARFTWGFFERLLARKVYPCDLAVKVAIDHKEGIKRHYSNTRESDKGKDEQHRQRQHERAKLGSSTRSSTVDSIAEEVGEASSSGNAEETDTGASDALPPLKYGTINDTLPEDWEVVSADKMGNFYCGNMAYMAPDANFFSAALMNDGLLDLVTVDGNISPAKSLTMLLSVEENKFFDNPLVHYRKISAFRLTPKDQKDGYISIDGERIPFVPFQAEIHQGLGRVIAKRAGSYAAPGPTNWEKVSTAERLMA